MDMPQSQSYQNPIDSGSLLLTLSFAFDLSDVDRPYLLLGISSALVDLRLTFAIDGIYRIIYRLLIICLTATTK